MAVFDLPASFDLELEGRRRLEDENDRRAEVKVAHNLALLEGVTRLVAMTTRFVVAAKITLKVRPRLVSLSRIRLQILEKNQQPLLNPNPSMNGNSLS